MACKEIQQNIEAYLDAELTLSDRRDFEEHLSECPDCQAMLESVRSLSKSIHKIGYVSRPTSLRRNIKNGLRDITGEESSSFNLTQLLGFSGASAAFASITIWFIMSFMVGLPIQTHHTEELISAHVRSLMADHVTDVASSDRHTVKPWFNGKLDFSPTVLDLKDKGFPLVGGRLDYLQKQPVAALIYKRRAHVINLFIRRSEQTGQTSPARLTQQQGYKLLSWQQQGLQYTLVSDLNARELQAFSRLLHGSKN
ncbi:MAG: anti-sigma factor [Gammaproteobacteria bacterium]|nr:anti-sigma factor [Gammaproteobacteria bacterium]